jgi:peptide-methionine (S)-S-oxide reductase
MAIDENGQRTLQLATLGGGCFWCLEAVYELLNGVEAVVSGYSGGHVDNPSYRAVCNGTTGHVEVVQISFDPTVIAFRDLLDVFFTVHDPTTLNRQGNDVGTQYRSAIFYHDEVQKQVAEQTIADFEAQAIWSGSFVTEVVPFEKFYRAEDYHQEYYRNNKWQPYCQAVVRPKVAKARKYFVEKLKA